MNGGNQGLGQDALALGGVQLEAPAFEEGLSGFVRTANGPIVEAEGRHVHPAVPGLAEGVALLGGGECEEQGGRPVVSSFSQDCLRSEDEAVEQHRSKYEAGRSG